MLGVINRQSSIRSGLRIKGHRGNSEVRDCLVKYARWLRTKYEFPIRVPVYLHPSVNILTQDGDFVSASFFAPFSREEEPLIRIATGDYPKLEQELGRDNALAAFIVSLSHEVVHYRQWIETGDVHESGVNTRATKMLHEYSEWTAHP